ncbi:hypothetical protein SBADM41S_00927 [Streptomyces badius]
MTDELLDAVRQRLARSGAAPTPAGVAAALRAQGRLLGDAEVLGAAAELRGELVGTGVLEPLLADPEVTDVLVSAPDRVWVDRGGGLQLTGVTFPDAAAVRRLAQRLAAVAGRRLDDARPWVDARLPDGTRMHAVLPPVAVASTCLSLRVVRPRAFSLAELVDAGTVPPGGDRILRALVEARISYVISGGTGAGKTTLLSSLLGAVGVNERIVLAEARPPRLRTGPSARDPPGSSRPANQEVAGRAVSRRSGSGRPPRRRPDRSDRRRRCGEPKLARTAVELRPGGEPAEAWGRFGEIPGAGSLARCLYRAGATGAPAADPIARLAASIRAERAAAAVARAQRAGVLITAPVGLCFLPAFLAVGVAPVIIGLAGDLLATGGPGR